MRRFFLSLCVALLTIPSLLVRADTPAASREERLQAMQKIADGLHYQHGDITLHGGLAKIQVPSEFRYLGPDDAEAVLTKIWGNPPGAKPLGMILPNDVGPMEHDSWAVIVTYEEDGYVKDNDASTIDYNDLLKKMKEGTKEASAERQKQGYPGIELVGWATPPRYDAREHKMYWAKELRFDGEPEPTLNYNIRMLGRRGVLVLNAVAGMNQLNDIERATPAILSMVNFQEGHRYTDFNASTDKVATYGLAALVAGGLLAKGGFFKLLIAGLLAAKKFVIIAFAAAAAGIKKFFAKITGRDKANDSNSLLR